MTKPRFIVFPLRFTNDAPTMVAFLETMGLHKAVCTKSDGFAVLHGRSGAVMVHGTQTAESLAGHGSTTLNFAVASVAAAAELLHGSGYETHAWDESYGTQGVVRHPSGQLIGLNAEDEEDLYGYQVHPRAGTPMIDVVAVCASPDFVRDADYFAALRVPRDNHRSVLVRAQDS
jgi:hypothetical protein